MNSDLTPDASVPSPTPSVPDALQKGGLVDAMLERARQNVTNAPAKELDQLYQRIGRDVERLRNACLRPFGQVPGSVSSAREAYEFAIASDFMGRAQWDFVFRYGLARHEGLDRASQLLQKEANQAYLRKADLYDQLLGDLIPADFRTEARQELERQTYGQGTNVTAAQDWAAYRRQLQGRRQRRLLGLSTGLPGLDAALGGLRGLTFLAGDPWTGKTSLALAMAVAAIRRHEDVAVLFFSLDMSKAVLYDRLACHDSGLDHRRLLASDQTEEEIRALEQSHERLGEEILPRLRIVDRDSLPPDEPLSADIFRRYARELLQASGAGVVLTIIDHFRLLGDPDTDRAEPDADRARLALLREFQDRTPRSGEPLGFPFLVIAPVRKPGQGQRSLVLADVFGSADIGYTADAVLLMWRLPDVPVPPGPNSAVALKLAKGRDGAVETQLTLVFDWARCRFTELASDPGRARGDKSPPAASRTAAVDPLAGSGEG